MKLSEDLNTKLESDSELQALKRDRDTLQKEIAAQECIISDVEWKLQGNFVVDWILTEKLFELQGGGSESVVNCELIQDFIQDLKTQNYAQFQKAGNASSKRADFQTMYDSINKKCGERHRQIVDAHETTLPNN